MLKKTVIICLIMGFLTIYGLQPVHTLAANQTENVQIKSPPLVKKVGSFILDWGVRVPIGMTLIAASAMLVGTVEALGAVALTLSLPSLLAGIGLEYLSKKIK